MIKKQKNSENYRTKRAQVSLFVVLGMVLLLSSITYLYLTFKTDKTGTVPSRTSPVENFVYNCLDQVSREAILTLGNQGGFIYLPEELASDPGAYLSQDPNGFSKIPYWYYNGKTVIPTIESMEYEISAFVAENLPGCINNFSIFGTRYEVTEKQQASVETSINDKTVVVKTIYPLDVFDYEGQTKSYDTFTTPHDVQLKQMYELSRQIILYENEKAFLENITINLMAMDDNIPFTGAEFSCNVRKWYLSDIQREIQDLAYFNYPRIRFKNTDYIPFLHSESDYKKRKEGLEDAYEYHNLLVEPSKDDYEGITAAAVYYPVFGINIQARPSSRTGVLESSRGRGQDLLRYLCLNMYHFTYDVYFPVLIITGDKDAFNGQGYAFRFVTPVMINHNEPDRAGIRFETLQAPTKYDPDFCSQLGTKAYDLRAVGSDGQLFGIELKDADLYYNCFNIECYLGKTANNDGVYKLKTAVPSGCSGGYIRAEKEGYLDNALQLTGESLEIPLTKLKKLKLSFRKQEDGALGADKELDDDQSVTFSLKGLTNEFEYYGHYDLEREYAVELPLDNGMYEMESTLLKDDKYVGGFIGNITISFEMLQSSNEIQFGVVEKSFVPLLESEKLELMNYLYSDAYQQYLQPVYK